MREPVWCDITRQLFKSNLMPITDYHAKYYAYELTKRCPSDSLEKLTASLSDAQVDLNPHQVEAALFAFRSPFSKGAILADEVGLGKTIEAGILLSQKWAERKRKILIILPSSLRKQWNQELLDKFFLPSVILEAKSFNKLVKQGKSNPFEQDSIVLCSYHFARNKDEFIRAIPWDLVVLDEAHRVRNVYKPSNKIGKAIKAAIDGRHKILLTATPLQNSLLELYGLVSFIDDYTFGDFKSFKRQFARLTGDDSFDDLKSRLAPICKRTLRRQVLEYIRYTNRIAIVEEFTPTNDEQILYNYVSEYLQRPNLQALPASQRTLMTLILRKLLASSTFAIAGTIYSLINRLKARLRDAAVTEDIPEELSEDYELLEEIEDEWAEDESEPEEEEREILTEEDVKAIEGEIAELQAFYEIAESITQNAKGLSLMKALKAGFARAKELGGRNKAIIFTESRRTQLYLTALLEDSEHQGKVVLFNGSNNDDKSKEIYKKWLEQHAGTDSISGSKTADMRAAIVDYFRDEAEIMIATESAAEGINLQFCSIVVNYDLPWNPQRIEQRIGRCHRYGQKHDVVVVNFLNKNNAADQRVYELLSEKFQLFSGVFGVSDEVLGSIESGVDFEKRIARIYQECRTPDEITLSFDELQKELEEQIEVRMKDTRQQLLENFDEEVHEKLKVNLKESTEYLNKYEQWLWELSKFYLMPHAEFIDGNNAFRLKNNPFPDTTIPTGLYRFGKNIEDAHLYRLGHPLAQNIISEVRGKKLSDAEVIFDYSGTPTKISILEPLVTKSGYLTVTNLTVEALEAEDYLVFSGIGLDGKKLDEEQCRRMFSLPSHGVSSTSVSDLKAVLKADTEKQKNEIIDDIAIKNADFFEDEMDKLDKWAEDKRNSLKLTLKDLDDQIKELKRNARTANNLPDKLAAQKKARTLEKKRDEAWHEYDAAGRKIEEQKDKLIDRIEKKLEQTVTMEELFSIKWRLV